MTDELTTALVKLVAALAAAAVAWALSRVTEAARGRMHSDTLNSALDALAKVVAYVVTSLQQTTVGPAKDPARPGLWDETRGAEVKARALAVIEALSAAPRKRLRELGMSDEQTRALIAEMIEASVLTVKHQTEPPPAPEAGTP